MNVPLRALTWAVRFFWIIALAVAVTCVYSATLIRVRFGEPIANFSEEELIATLPILFDNKGYYDITDFEITTIISDRENQQLSNATTHIAQISSLINTTIFHNISLSLNEIIAKVDWLFNDTNFILRNSAHMRYADLIPFGFNANNTIPWGAPLHNFTTGTQEHSVYNATHLRVSVPISFQNHSPYFSVTGDVRMEILNNDHQLLGESVLFVNVPSNANYEGQFEILVDRSMMTGSGQVHVYVETEIFNYGPMVTNYG